jgi:endonuclease-8
MPEGDTIWRAARLLHAGLVGAHVTGFTSVLPAVRAAAQRLALVGRSVTAVEARGKHLLVHFSGGPTLHTHLGMSGRWVLRDAGLTVPAAAAACLETATRVACCFRAPVVELLTRPGLTAHAALRNLGPDLLAADFSADAARARLRALGAQAIGVALLDQTALAGIGNVYKSEVLFLCGVDPRTPVAALDDAALGALIATAARLLAHNLGAGRRRTTSRLAREALWVYRRAGQPCLRCAHPITRIVQGGGANARLPRSTYFCARCQRLPPAG